jgi:hypothetical protein
VRFTLSQSATVTLTVEQALPGRLNGGRCQAPTRRDRRHRRCTRLVLLPGNIMLAGRAGANAFSFIGAIDRHALGPGCYRLLATTGGRTGDQQQTPFQITH